MQKPFSVHPKPESYGRVMGEALTRLILKSFGRAIWLLIGFGLAVGALPEPAWAQKKMEMGRSIYRERRITTGYFEEVDVTSRLYAPLVGGPNLGRRFINLPPRAGTVRRWRTFLADSHYGIKILKLQKCVDCHPREARDIHTTRAGITCRQCHGMEPIAGINHYYSSMNSTRRHSHVCAKCHEGANNSYATYVVHEPNPTAMATRSTFPMLFYVFWFMVVFVGGTFVVFLPHTVMWGIRELFVKNEKTENEPKAEK